MSRPASRLPLTLLAATALAGSIAFAAAPARASLEIELQSGGQSFTQASATSPLFVEHSIGNFSISIDSGLASSTPELDLSSQNLSTTGAGALTITLSENGLTSPIGAENWLTQFSGNAFSGAPVTVSLQTYLDSTDTLLGTDTPLASLGSTSSPFALSAIDAASMSGPFAITEVLTVTATGQSVTSLDASVTAVPEPASLALLGSALFGMGLIRRRRNG